MKNYLTSLSFGLTLLFISGCGHTPVRSVFPASLPPHTAETAAASARAEKFKSITAKLPLRGVALYPAAFAGSFTDKEVLDAVSRLGFNRIYCCLTSEQEFDERLTAFLTEAASRNIPVELVLSQQDFYRQYRANRLIRGFFVQYPDLCEAVQRSIEYNAELPENIRFSGWTIILTPHLFNGNNTERIRGHIYRWDEKRYGIGGDNDMLMRESFEYAAKIAALPGLGKLTIAVPDFFHEAAVSGQLSCGKITDFTAIADKVAVINSANLPSKLPGMIAGELAEAGEKGKILAVVPIAGHISETEGKLRRRNWDDFQRSMDNLIRKSTAYDSFGGVIVSPLAVVEYLRQEK